MIDGEPWSVAADVCRILFAAFNPYAGTTMWLLGLDESERRVARRRDHETIELFKGQNKTHSLGIISESGLYKLIMRADSCRAKPFQTWVTRDVLPAIRKTGSYQLSARPKQEVLPPAAQAYQLPSTLSEALRAYADEVDRREQSGRVVPYGSPSHETTLPVRQASRIGPDWNRKGLDGTRK